MAAPRTCHIKIKLDLSAGTKEVFQYEVDDGRPTSGYKFKVPVIITTEAPPFNAVRWTCEVANKGESVKGVDFAVSFEGASPLARGEAHNRMTSPNTEIKLGIPPGHATGRFRYVVAVHVPDVGLFVDDPDMVVW
jgi:hypothetical protein